MPIMDGLEFLDELQLSKGQPVSELLDRVVVLSASVNPHYEKQAKSKGVKWYFHKPISATVLKTVLSSVA